MTVATCDNSTLLCPGGATKDYDAANHSSEDLVQHKNNHVTITVMGQTIYLYRRSRDFTLSVSDDATWTGGKIIPDGSGDYAFCGTYSGSSSGSCSENAIAVDSIIHFCDADIGVMFWEERTDTCTFNCPTGSLAQFRGDFGYANLHKLSVGSVSIHHKREFKLMVNGAVEIIETIESDSVYNSHLILVWPTPPSLGGFYSDVEILAYGFYDYNAGGPEESTAKALSEGGKDFYYPTWLQAMGVDKSREQAEAEQRYYAYYLHDGDNPETISIPPLPYAEVKGNAMQDADGNVLLSFTGVDVTVNRLYPTGGLPYINLNSAGILDGANLKLAPVGVI